jgi:hypothetical protein
LEDDQILKVQLQRQEGGDSSLATQINKALFTLKFLNCSESGFTPAEKHWKHHNKQHLPQVLWKDVMTGAWQGLGWSCYGAEARLVFFLKVHKAQFGYSHSL